MKIHIVSHTHWDREWYRPFQYFKVKLSYFFDKLLKIMEEKDEYTHFMLDGQMVMIEDYLNLEPQNKEKIKQLVKEGRLIIGPWYSQPDEFAPNGESLVRNLLMGTNMASEYGQWMKVGYLPDSFGQSCQMPQILKGCNIESACIMRGIPAHKLNRTEFIWKGLNGDEVLTVALPKGYSNGMFLPKKNLSIDLRVKKIVGDLKKVGNKENILIMNGVDHQFAQPQIAEYIKRKNGNKYLHSTLENYIEDAKKDKNELITLDGELITPVTNRVHTSIASSRMYQKTKNREMETLLSNRVEPLCTLSYLLGADYPKNIINSAWKEMFKNQAHDSICGCCTDEVHREIDGRFNDVENMGITLQKMHSRSIAALSAENNLVLTVLNDSMVKGIQTVNTTVYTASDEFELIDEDGNEVSYAIKNSERIDVAGFSIWAAYLETPCMANKVDISFEVDFDFNYGYKRLTIAEGKKPKHSTGCSEIETRTLENEFSVVSLNSDGTFNLLDKQSGQNYYNLNTIEDCGDAGDTYNYSPVEEDIIVTSKQAKDATLTVKEDVNKKTAYLSYELLIPESLSDEGKTRSSALIPLKVQSKITLYNNIKRIDIKTKIANNVRDHRLRAVFPTGIKSDSSYAETQFGTIKRSNEIEGAKDWKENKWDEKPLPIYSNHKFVYVKKESAGLAVLNRGLTEYEIYNHEGSAIGITLLRGVGYMGKEDLAIRPGRPSGVHVATPDAQCLGEHVFEYSVLASSSETEIAQQAAKYNAEPTAVQSEIRLTEITKKFGAMRPLFDLERLQDCAQNKLKGVKKTDYNFININENRLIVSALKKAEKEDAVIIRLYNSTKGKVNSAKIFLNGKISKVYECDFLECNTAELKFSDSTFNTNTIKGYTAQTYKVVME